ncbi:DUF4232 domain-containing protein [Leifsonia sp. ZF2019]|uniref:DUF4232 domain-containing protein n=1 Tax=Leifsonia sp. ZF2019 TaxID=2781978 RepID=UPI001CBFF454|nr:DUF4232 domain-containing protein [Leifsonia sp. ZF2019]
MAITKNRFLTSIAAAGALIAGGIATPSLAQAAELTDAPPCQFNQPNGQGATFDLYWTRDIRDIYVVHNNGLTACSVENFPVLQATHGGEPVGGPSVPKRGDTSPKKVVVEADGYAYGDVYFDSASSSQSGVRADELKVTIADQTVKLPVGGMGFYGPSDSTTQWIKIDQLEPIPCFVLDYDLIDGIGCPS